MSKLRYNLVKSQLNVLNSNANTASQLLNVKLFCLSSPTSLWKKLLQKQIFSTLIEFLFLLLFNSDRIYCPYPNCSVLLDLNECLSSRVSSSINSENSCVECPVCQRFICVDCGVPWHSSTTCEEYQRLPRDASDINLPCVAQNKRWRCCEQCHRMVELRHGCYHMTCWCDHEFCYSCGSCYIHGQQTCQCTFWDDEYSEYVVNHQAQEFEQWAWDSFGSMPLMDAYSDQERSQLALIQRFLAGGFSLTDPIPDQSPPHCTDTYAETLKNLHQLPWLE